MRIKFLLNKEFKHFMKLKGWTNKDIVEKTGYTKQQISRTLNQNIELTVPLLKKLCQISGLDGSRLIETKRV